MIHPDTEARFVDRTVGWGVFALRPLPCGTVTWVRGEEDQPLPGRRLPPNWIGITGSEERVNPEDRFLYQDQQGQLVLLGDHARYVNHACDPNTAGGRDDRFSIAIRDIEPGEQLTEDYGELAAFQPFTCGCGSPRCRRRIQPLIGRELLLHQRAVDLALRAMSHLPPQPLQLPGDPSAKANLPG